MLPVTRVEHPMKELARLGQSIWLDYIRRNLIASGELSVWWTKGSAALRRIRRFLKKPSPGARITMICSPFSSATRIWMRPPCMSGSLSAIFRTRRTCCVRSTIARMDDPLLSRGASAGLLRLLRRLGLLARNQRADANEDQRQTHRCRNSRLHKCLRLAEWHDQDPTQVLLPLRELRCGTTLSHPACCSRNSP